MRQMINLSYPLGVDTPLYPDTPKIEINPLKTMDAGDSCNTFSVSLCNHSGTHVDAPNHFIKDAKTICDYALSELNYKTVEVIDCPKEPKSLIEVSDLENSISNLDIDILLIKTGFSRYRKSNSEIYSYENPCISPDAAKWIRSHLSSLKAIGLDSISVASRSHRNLGKETHEILLGKWKNQETGLLLLEDIYIPADLDTLDEVLIVPWFIKGVDSSPCTVIGVIY